MERTLGYKKISRRDRMQPKQEIFTEDQSMPTILKEVAIIICKQDVDNLPKFVCLSYLNDAVRTTCKKREENSLQTLDACEEDWNCKEIKLKYFYLLQCCLLHKEKEVRATGLRLLRYVIDCSLDVECLKEVNAIPLIIRCIDICTDNHIERVHGLRLARRMLQVSPHLFPESVGRCLVAIARNGNEEKDRILKSAQAVLLELAILNPLVFVKCDGVSCLMRGILECPLPRINEALLSTFLYLMNNPQWRKYCSQFHTILSPLSDFFTPGDEMHRIARDKQTEASSLAVLAALRSWTGLIMLYQKRDKALKSIVELLVLPNEVTQRCIILLLFDLFRIPVGNWHSDFDTALKERAAVDSVDADAFRLREGFIVAEAKVTLQHIAKFRPNLVQNYLSLVLYTFMKMDLFPALCTVIVSASDDISVKATMLLGELLHEATQNMPSDCSAMCHILPLLSTKAIDSEGKIKIRASEAISALLRLSRILVSRKSAPVVSLFLREILARRKGTMTRRYDRAGGKLSRWLHNDRDELVRQAIKNSKVLIDGLPSDKWSMHHLIPVFTWPSDSLLMLEEPYYKLLVRKLLLYYKPSSKQFSIVELSNPQARVQADVLLLFITFLIDANQTTEGKYLTELLEDIRSSLESVACERPSHDLYFSPTKLNTTASQYYFLAIGHILRSSIGYDLVNKAGIFTQLINIVEITAHDANACMYEKIISSSLDYSKDGLSREILRRIMKNKRESSRIYATQLLKVFVRANVANFDKWGIELLVEQLSDKSKLVALCALEVLDEALDDKKCLEAVLQVAPSVPHLGDQWQLLRAKISSSPRGFASYYEGKLIPNLLEKWAKTFNVKYVKLMQTALAESLTRLQRGEDGLYGRRTGNKHVVHDVYLLPHLYGSLTVHKDGFATLVQHDHVQVLLLTVRDGQSNTPQEILQLKAAIWALGHLGRSRSGVAFLSAENIFASLCDLAANSPIYSLRGTIFYAFCLIASTDEGVAALKKIGWASVCRHHHEVHQSQNLFGWKNNAHSCQEGSDIDEADGSRSAFYIDEFEEDVENFCMADDFNDTQSTPKKAQTLPHDMRPPYHSIHQRSLSDCAQVIEEMPIAEANQETNFIRKGSRLKNKILSSFRNRSGKRRDSACSKVSNVSSTSERFVSFLQSSTRRQRRNTRTSTDCDELDSNLSYSMTDATYSDDDVGSSNMDSPPIVRPSLSPIASGTSLSTCDSHVDSVYRMRSSQAIDINSSRRKKHSFSGFAYPQQRVNYRRGISECSHDDSSAKNSLLDFLVSSSEKSPYLSGSIADRCIVKSSSVCSEVSSIRSLSTVSVRGSGANLPARSYGLQSLRSAIDVHPSGQCYLGMSLPLDVDKLLLDDSIRFNNSSDIIPDSLDGSPTTKEEFRKEAEKNYCLQHHTVEKCLSCYCLNADSDIIDLESATVDEKSLIARKQILKCVSQLCGSHCPPYEEAKKGLLYIKHVAASGFQDGCTYAEIFHLISAYSFCLNARRLIQELFEDFKFPAVLTEARRLISQFDARVFDSVAKTTAQYMAEGGAKDLDPIDEFAGFNYERGDDTDEESIPN